MSSGKKEPSKRQLSDEEDEPVLKRPHISATADNPVNLELQSATCDAANSSTSWIGMFGSSVFMQVDNMLYEQGTGYFNFYKVAVLTGLYHLLLEFIISLCDVLVLP